MVTDALISYIEAEVRDAMRLQVSDQVDLERQMSNKSAKSIKLTMPIEALKPASYTS